MDQTMARAERSPGEAVIRQAEASMIGPEMTSPSGQVAQFRVRRECAIIDYRALHASKPKIMERRIGE